MLLPSSSSLDDPFVELDLADAAFDAAGFEALSPRLEAALDAMAAIEAGEIANRTEGRMVGHYWLRAPLLAPDEVSEEIGDALAAVQDFARRVHAGEVRPKGAERFTKLLLCGIGGSALGPMLLEDALGGRAQKMSFFAFDNTDPDGFARILAEVGDLEDALVLVISKSGGTPETRNAMLEVRAACEAQGLVFGERAVAVTGVGSALAGIAESESWLGTFPMWDWVGGRTSVCSAVGMLPAALLGLDVRGFLAGAAAMDEKTRSRDLRDNPAAMLAAFWHLEGGGRGARDMVVLPYADRLLLFSRYLQQLVMESLGKREDRAGNEVHQGLTVYGNKGSTDQHAYVQQLRDGLHSFFAVFVRVLENGGGIDVGDGAHTGDYLHGFFLGTRSALTESGRRSATITLQTCDERSLGALIALFERAVGIYAELIDVNAYDQPGVEAGKRAASAVLKVQHDLLGALGDEPMGVAEGAAATGADPRLVFELFRHLAATRDGIRGTGFESTDTARIRRG